MIQTFIGKFTTLDPNIEDIFVYNLLEGDGTNDKNNSEFVIINDSLFSNSIFDYEDENVKSIYVVVFDQTNNTLNKSFQINIGNSFEVPVLINPIADVKTNIDSLFTFTIPENSFWFEFNFARSYQAFLKGSEQLPEWLSFDQLSGTFLGTPGYSGSFEIVVLAKNWGITSLPDTFLIDVLPYTSNTKKNIFNNEPNIYPNPASNQIRILTSFPIDFVAISDISGRWIYQGKLNGLTSTTIQVEKFPRGIYTIIVKNDKQIFTRKIILQ